MESEIPNYLHHCTKCRFLGVASSDIYGCVDLYWCKRRHGNYEFMRCPVLIIRISSNRADHGVLSYLYYKQYAEHPPPRLLPLYKQALILATQKGYILKTTTDKLLSS